MPIGYFVQVRNQKNVGSKLRSSNTSNISLELVAQHCCFATMLPVLPGLLGTISRRQSGKAAKRLGR